jgi:hypothetical protein
MARLGSKTNRNSSRRHRQQKPLSLPRGLATRFFAVQGRPDRWNKEEPKWATLFDGLLNSYPYEDLSRCLTWAFEIDTFWPQKLIRGDQDPMEYFVAKIDKVLPRSIGYYRALQNQGGLPTLLQVNSARLGPYRYRRSGLYHRGGGSLSQ